MTSILYDKSKKIILCDSREVDIDHKVISDSAKKFAVNSKVVAVVAGNAEYCTTFLELVNDEQMVTARDFYQKTDQQQFACILVSKETGQLVKGFYRALYKEKPRCELLYEGAGGDFLRHNYVVSDFDFEIAYDRTVQDCYTLSGGSMRYYNLSTGDNNMEESEVVVLNAANDSDCKRGIFALATMTPGTVRVDHDNPDESEISLEELGF
ncbi:hypothetical protein C4G41_RS22485 [Vibrio parahaemolyticus]|uniref:hypothetical protein n=1 Tax=Vibrio parahaemolyticus TaxID=670 RepID=UPI001DEB269A|nr:hypothetical protein [Vibrio parahaemolyticus]EGQ8700357.1 hypothetical protein [Vibrio parahaemolyticus]EGQ8754594.1 hypothetical protein [Vibrio parahaemolyticus]EGQ8759379.1 hypothetical protein [Vibrio parahaemolyticus]EGQ8774076.1 hypothetical protein [Vibrio parahaemolyticus]EGQ8823676.1 hypothetical protein [Vibrio parahaemolyticus]